MKLIVGLGNPEQKYFKTFHNVGFLAVEDTAIILGATFSKTVCRALIAETRVNGEKVILAKPLTYMNLSGESVRELVNYFKIDLSDLLVMYDDYDIEKGHLRLREKGASGTHNGLRNIVKELGSQDFKRIRIGILDKESKVPLLDYVLSNIKKEDYELFANTIGNAAKAAVEFAKGTPFDRIMQTYNGKQI
ncbi:MAG: aminoacyl-tRNA hydrolase [Clostridiales bacterium]|nr:aminoacyl-tRNA hydrolase [Clostridiales bacterium]